LYQCERFTLDGWTAEAPIRRWARCGHLPGTVRGMPRPEPHRITTGFSLAGGDCRAHEGCRDCQHRPQWQGSDAGFSLDHRPGHGAATSFPQDGLDVTASTISATHARREGADTGAPCQTDGPRLVGRKGLRLYG